MEVGDDVLHDPTQVVPSSLYSLAMFNAEESDESEEDASHCEPGTNEFTAPIQHTNPLLAFVLDQDPSQGRPNFSYGLQFYYPTFVLHVLKTCY